jgi:hypothetical protein
MKRKGSMDGLVWCGVESPRWDALQLLRRSQLYACVGSVDRGSSEESAEIVSTPSHTDPHPRPPQRTLSVCIATDGV